jgi:hypothetical protein
MLRAGFCLRDDTLPRTEYWKLFLTSFEQSQFFGREGTADLLIPFEDTAIETNWPRYGNRASAYVRGQPHDLSDNGQFQKYFAQIVNFAQRNPTQKLLYVNMHPFLRVPFLLRHHRNITVADVSLAWFERDLNHNTISMPAFPIVFSQSAVPGIRPIMASFQGVNSHPIRELLTRIANGRTIVVNFVHREHHVGKIDAVKGQTDQEYKHLLANSNFAFVPRGDALFSYRLAEVMSFGCIPIILSEGWVLPFDRILRWEEISLRVPAYAVLHLPQILGALTSEDILSRQKKVLAAYDSRLANMDCVISGLMAEAEILATYAR